MHDFHCLKILMVDRNSLIQIVLDAIEQVGGIFVVTADHGNAEDMVKRDKSGKPLRDKDGNVQPLTSHTLNPVGSLPDLLCFAIHRVNNIRMQLLFRTSLSETICRFPSPLEALAFNQG